MKQIKCSSNSNTIKECDDCDDKSHSLELVQVCSHGCKMCGGGNFSQPMNRGRRTGCSNYKCIEFTQKTNFACGYKCGWKGPQFWNFSKNGLQWGQHVGGDGSRICKNYIPKFPNYINFLNNKYTQNDYGFLNKFTSKFRYLKTTTDPILKFILFLQLEKLASDEYSNLSEDFKLLLKNVKLIGEDRKSQFVYIKDIGEVYHYTSLLYDVDKNIAINLSVLYIIRIVSLNLIFNSNLLTIDTPKEMSQLEFVKSKYDSFFKSYLNGNLIFDGLSTTLLYKNFDLTKAEYDYSIKINSFTDNLSSLNNYHSTLNDTHILFTNEDIILGSIWDTIGGWGGEIIHEITTDAAAAGKIIHDGATDFINGAGEFIDFFEEIFIDIGKGISSAWNATVKFISNTTDIIGGELVSIINININFIEVATIIGVQLIGKAFNIKTESAQNLIIEVFDEVIKPFVDTLTMFLVEFVIDTIITILITAALIASAGTLAPEWTPAIFATIDLTIAAIVDTSEALFKPFVKLIQIIGRRFNVQIEDSLVLGRRTTAAVEKLKSLKIFKTQVVELNAEIQELGIEIKELEKARDLATELLETVNTELSGLSPIIENIPDLQAKLVEDIENQEGLIKNLETALDPISESVPREDLASELSKKSQSTKQFKNEVLDLIQNGVFDQELLDLLDEIKEVTVNLDGLFAEFDEFDEFDRELRVAQTLLKSKVESLGQFKFKTTGQLDQIFSKYNEVNSTNFEISGRDRDFVNNFMNKKSKQFSSEKSSYRIKYNGDSVKTTKSAFRKQIVNRNTQVDSEIKKQESLLAELKGNSVFEENVTRIQELKNKQQLSDLEKEELEELEGILSNFDNSKLLDQQINSLTDNLRIEQESIDGIVRGINSLDEATFELTEQTIDTGVKEQYLALKEKSLTQSLSLSEKKQLDIIDGNMDILIQTDEKERFIELTEKVKTTQLTTPEQDELDLIEVKLDTLLSKRVKTNQFIEAIKREQTEFSSLEKDIKNFNERIKSLAIDNPELDVDEVANRSISSYFEQRTAFREFSAKGEIDSLYAEQFPTLSSEYTASVEKTNKKFDELFDSINDSINDNILTDGPLSTLSPEELKKSKLNTLFRAIEDDINLAVKESGEEVYTKPNGKDNETWDAIFKKSFETESNPVSSLIDSLPTYKKARFCKLYVNSFSVDKELIADLNDLYQEQLLLFPDSTISDINDIIESKKKIDGTFRSWVEFSDTGKIRINKAGVKSYAERLRELSLEKKILEDNNPYKTLQSIEAEIAELKSEKLSLNSESLDAIDESMIISELNEIKKLQEQIVQLAIKIKEEEKELQDLKNFQEEFVKLNDEKKKFMKQWGEFSDKITEKNNELQESKSKLQKSKSELKKSIEKNLNNLSDLDNVYDATQRAIENINKSQEIDSGIDGVDIRKAYPDVNFPSRDDYNDIGWHELIKKMSNHYDDEEEDYVSKGNLQNEILSTEETTFEISLKTLDDLLRIENFNGVVIENTAQFQDLQSKFNFTSDETSHENLMTHIGNGIIYYTKNVYTIQDTLISSFKEVEKFNTFVVHNKFNIVDNSTVYNQKLFDDFQIYNKKIRYGDIVNLTKYNYPNFNGFIAFTQLDNTLVVLKLIEFVEKDNNGKLINKWVLKKKYINQDDYATIEKRSYVVMNYKPGKSQNIDDSIVISSTIQIGGIIKLLDWINDLTYKISIKYAEVMREKKYSHDKLIGCVLWRCIGFNLLN